VTYTQQTWIDGEFGGTPLSAARLNYMEAGISAAEAGKVLGTGVTEVRALTQTAYDGLGTKNATTLYVITG
jgi:hypothetical protein